MKLYNDLRDQGWYLYIYIVFATRQLRKFKYSHFRTLNPGILTTLQPTGKLNHIYLAKKKNN